MRQGTINHYFPLRMEGNFSGMTNFPLFPRFLTQDFQSGGGRRKMFSLLYFEEQRTEITVRGKNAPSKKKLRTLTFWTQGFYSPKQPLVYISPQNCRAIILPNYTPFPPPSLSSSKQIVKVDTAFFSLLAAISSSIYRSRTASQSAVPGLFMASFPPFPLSPPQFLLSH